MNSDLPPVSESTNQTKSRLSSNLVTIALLIIVAVQSFALLYFFYKGTKSDSSSEIPVSYVPDKGATSVGISNMVSTPTLEDLPNPNNISNNPVANANFTLKSVLGSFCKVGSDGGYYISLQELPFDLSAVDIDFSNSSSLGSDVPCYPFEDEYGLGYGQIMINVVGNPNIFIYDPDSQEGGHGGISWLGNLEDFYQDGNIVFTWSLDRPDGGFCSTEGYFEVPPVVMRGTKTIIDYNGDPIYITTDRVAISKDDPRLIKTTEKYLDCSKDFQVALGQLENAVKQEFFANSENLLGSEKKARDELNEVLNSIVPK